MNEYDKNVLTSIVANVIDPKGVQLSHSKENLYSLKFNSKGDLEYIVPIENKKYLIEASNIPGGFILFIFIIIFMFFALGGNSIFSGLTWKDMTIFTLILCIPILFYYISTIYNKKRKKSIHDTLIIFNKEKQFFYKGNKNDYYSRFEEIKTGKIKCSLISFELIDKIIIISKRIGYYTSPGSGYSLYLINLITKNRQEVKLITQSNYSQIQKDAQIIGKFIGVPVEGL